MIPIDYQLLTSEVQGRVPIWDSQRLAPKLLEESTDQVTFSKTFSTLTKFFSIQTKLTKSNFSMLWIESI